METEVGTEVQTAAEPAVEIEVQTDTETEVDTEVASTRVEASGMKWSGRMQWHRPESTRMKWSGVEWNEGETEGAQIEESKPAGVVGRRTLRSRSHQQLHTTASTGRLPPSSPPQGRFMWL